MKRVFFLFWIVAGILVFTTSHRSMADPVPPASDTVTYGGVAFHIMPETYGKGDMSKLTVYAFSQANDSDPQVLDLVPDIVPRAWAKWDRGGLQSSDYDWDYLKACHEKGITFIGGGTATVFFRDEARTQAEFDSMVSLDAQGQPFKIQIGANRGSLASTAYRKYLIHFCELQIDGGVDGLFFDELNGDYTGSGWRGDGGFDDSNTADFGRYLLVKHKNLTHAQWESRYQIKPEDHLWDGKGFDYRGYLKRNGWDSNPLSSDNPLEEDWGHPSGNHPDPDEGTFTQDYPNLVYWQSVVATLREYARKKYGREILITANGVFPFVDFQCVGLYDWNHDGPGGSEVNYIPVKDGHLDGTVSLQEAFQGLKARSLRVARREVPVSLFLDWPGDFFQRYIKLPLQDKEDYWRLYAAEAYANGLYFCFHLRTTTGEPTADQQGMMPFFRSYTVFYRKHADLYHGAQDLAGPVTTSVSNVMTNLVRLPDGRTVLHLVNHHYSSGFRIVKGMTVSFPLDGVPKKVTAISPDRAEEIPLKFTFADGQLKTQVPQLESYVALVVE